MQLSKARGTRLRHKSRSQVEKALERFVQLLYFHIIFSIVYVFDLSSCEGSF